MKQKISKKLLNRLIIIDVLIILFSFWPYILRATIPEAELKLSYDDGIQCYLNNVEIASFLNEDHGATYWNRKIGNIGNYLKAGQNLIACRVSNGDGNTGTGYGGFDLELVVAGQTVIAKSSSGWKIFGEKNKITPPPRDINNRNWYEINYNDGTWRDGTAPFGGRGKDILSEAPDDGWFRKSFNLDSSLFGSSISSFTDNCSSFNNQIDCLNQGWCYWSGSYCQSARASFDELAYRFRSLSRTGCWKPTIHKIDRHVNLPENLKEIILETPVPLITGLVKYGNQIEIYVDDNSIGKAVVKEGESTGVANFYFKPKTSIVPQSDYLIPHTLKIVAFNPYDQSTCETQTIKFIVTPYPAPILHRLGEIPYLPRANRLVIKTKKPLITGLVKYGSVVDIFIDDKYIGRAKVKEGEKSGWANFYLTLKNPLSLGEHTLYAIAKKAGQEDVESLPSQVYTFTVE